MFWELIYILIIIISSLFLGYRSFQIPIRNWSVDDVGFLTSAIVTTGLLIQKIWLIRRKYNRTKNIKDAKLFSEFLELLPSQGPIYFLRSHCWNQSWDHDKVFPLIEFMHVWNDAEHEFIDSALEEKKDELRKSIDNFLAFYGAKTYPGISRNTKGYQLVPQEWKTTQEDKYWKTVEKLHSLSEEVVRSHQEFVRKARKRLRPLSHNSESSLEPPSVN